MSAMTVEHSQVDYVHNQRQSLFDQLKEITGVEDETVLEQALQASRIEGGTYDLTHAVNILVDENAVRSSEKTKLQQIQRGGVAVAIKRADICNHSEKPKEGSHVIDLTNDVRSEKEAFQKAIALSLQDQQRGMLGGQVSTEEQDISKVLEQSLLEAKAGTKRKREEVWLDPLNPYERKRIDDWPVGLKNVGNTCWFSAVIQSLFHLPVFQQLVLCFIPPEGVNETISHSVGRRNLLFMQELRRLFALMVGTERKYVDPSKAVDILKEAFPCGSSDSQQDVSEFTHKLVEWLEDAFRSEGCEKSSVEVDETEDTKNEDKGAKRSTNPMVDLFYGRFRSEGQNEGHIFSNEETFGQYPLQVNGFSNIHESLEAATAQEIESGKPCQESVSKSGQEHWFTKLPPVLLFELSRFQFNQHLGRPEKIHNKFDFPEVMYMDRYVEVNKNITKTKRDEVHKLRESREELQCKLDKYTNYGSGCKRFPLQDILQYTLEFVESKPDSAASTSSDVNMASPCSVSSMNTDSPCNSPAKSAANDSASQAKKIREQVGGCLPVPKHVSDSELKVLQTCLKRWRTEVEHDIRSLQDGLNSMDEAINSMYNEPSLQKVKTNSANSRLFVQVDFPTPPTDNRLPYRLHAVLVHEGQAASGHYWAYVYNHKNRIWMKFNDVTVTETTWNELQKESVGGYHNASAYCLMYIDCNKRDLVDDVVSKESGVENLPADMHQLVNEDNILFHKEMSDWDNSGVCVKEDESESECESSDEDETVLCTWDCEDILDNSIIQVLQHPAVLCCSNDAEIRLNKAVEREQIRWEKAAKETIDRVCDHRLEHILVYILVLQPTFPNICIRLNLLQHFASLKSKENSYYETIKKLAFNHVKMIKKSADFQAHKTLYDELIEDYKKFRFVAAYFIKGFEFFKQSQFTWSLPYWEGASYINDELMKKYNQLLSCVNYNAVLLFRRKCLLKLNKAALAGFESENEDSLSVAYHLVLSRIVPNMNLLSASDAPDEDVAVAETIRASWCSKLGEEISALKREKLEKLLGMLLEPSDFKTTPSLQNVEFSDGKLSERFACYKTNYWIF